MLKLQYVCWRWPSWMEVRVTGHNFENWPLKDHPCHVCFKLAYWFQRRRFLNIFSIGSYVKTMQGSTLTVVRLNGESEMRLRASENGTQLVQSGKWKWFCDMFNSWRTKWLILNYSVLEVAANFTQTSRRMYCVYYAILFYFVDYGIPLSQIKTVLIILANRECLIRWRRTIKIVFIFAGQWKARVICGVLILENYPWCVLPLRSKYWKRDRLLE
jgi:hypothetical protein